MIRKILENLEQTISLLTLSTLNMTDLDAITFYLKDSLEKIESLKKDKREDVIRQKEKAKEAVVCNQDGKIYSCIKEAALHYNLTPNSIYQSIHCGTTIDKYYTFEYLTYKI